MAAPDFSPKTIQTLAFRAGQICSNPDCSTLTVGPSDAKGDLALKLGEAAHIAGKKKGAARFREDMTDDERAAPDNGLWLCASCHTMVDKIGGVDFPEQKLRQWKTDHESIISSLLLTHRSTLPLLRRFTEEGHIAQEVVDLLEQSGAFFMAHEYEVPAHVTISVDRVRQELIQLNRRVKIDSVLKRIITDIGAYCRDFMNHSGKYNENTPGELNTLRNRVGVKLGRLEREFGCQIVGPLRQIVR